MRKKLLFFCMALGCLTLMSSDMCHPIFYDRTVSITCPYGAEALFQASVYGKPMPVLEMHFKDAYLDWDDMVYYSGQFRYKYNSLYYNSRCALLILCVDEYDEGRYSFTAHNELGLSKIYMELSVY